ncbi:hypothetical protein ACFQ0G_52795 [Streptomyces chiangmaiensis]
MPTTRITAVAAAGSRWLGHQSDGVGVEKIRSLISVTGLGHGADALAVAMRRAAV